MVEILPGNGLRSTLAVDATAGATTLQIASADAASWPTGGEYRAVLCADPTAGPFELVRVTGGQGTATLTVTRAVEPFNGAQTAQAWSSGTSIAAVLTHDGLQLAGGGVTMPLAQSLTFAANNTYDLATSANRARNLYLAGAANVGDLQASGTVGLGVAPSASYELYVAPSSTLTGTTQYGIFSAPTVPAAATTMAAGVASQVSTANASFTIAEASDFIALGPNYGASSAVTNSIGFHAANQGGARATNAYGVYIDAQSGAATTNIGLYNLGTTRLDGTIGLGSAPGSSVVINVAMNQLALTGTDKFGLYLNTYFNSSTTNTATSLYIAFQTQAAAFSLVTGYALYVGANFLGSGSSVSTMYGLYMGNQGFAGVNTAYGVYIAAQSGAATTNISLYNAGTTYLAGNIGTGNAQPQAGSHLTLSPYALTGSGQYGVNLTPSFNNAATVFGAALRIYPQTAASAFTMTSLYGILVDTGTQGAGSAVTSKYALYINNMGAAAVANAYGVYIAAQTGASTINIGLYNAGPTQLVNYLDMAELAAPGTPASGYLRFYPKSDHYLYYKDQTGTERAVGIDKALRTYIQTVMGTLNPGGPPVPPP